MKILMLMLSDNLGVGGLEKHTRELTKAMIALDHQVEVAAAPQHLEDLKGVTFYPVNTRRSRNSPALLLAILRIIRAGNYDVLHAQGTKAAFVLQRLAPFTKRQVRVATIHGFKSRYPKADAFHQLIAVSQALANDIAQPGVTVIYNGVSVTPQAPARLPAGTRRPVWLAVGRLAPVKGFDFLINAFQYCPGTLLIAGDGPEQQRLEELINSTGQSDAVKLLGFRTDVPALMAAVDGVVISSEREGFSYVCAEALLLGKPVISTDVPIANEFLPENHIIPAGAPPEVFARHLNINLENAFAAQATARKRAQTELTIDAMTKTTIQIYRECSER
ncbi:glycosyltransferase [Marinobacter halophilus]|uniref:Glycosyltransferase n=1 Tax=Marinobacter halophilus TaxID=1323740 RepID=A0A2T1KG53_9GAMM|nr:glycosyltransferase [Marinobacter halophilus]PSF09111.1 glycosyltransferase [Marinobacter halophilus]GGC83298.1 glycosyl transferase [Marinobacter halophilus]